MMPAPRRPFLLRERRRRSPSIASARRTWEREVRPRWASNFKGAVEGDLKRAIAIFDAHYLGTATVRVS